MTMEFCATCQGKGAVKRSDYGESMVGCNVTERGACLCSRCNGTGWVDMEEAPGMDLPASRTVDPASSHVAERNHTDSGVRGRNRALVYELVTNHPGATARELNEHSEHEHLDYHEIVRRLNDLADREGDNDQLPVVRGNQRECEVTGRLSLTWWRKEDKPVKAPAWIEEL